MGKKLTFQTIFTGVVIGVITTVVYDKFIKEKI